MIEPKLHTHMVQKNYSAIWYSLVIHFVMFVIIVNYAQIDIIETADNVFLSVKDMFVNIIIPSNDMINELLIKKETVLI